MLQKIKLKNFQNHKKKSFDFEKINCIIAPSDKGKSAIIRALRWICLNDPPCKEDKFITWGEELCEVELTVDDIKIGRRKGKGTNEYSIDEKVPKAFKTEVPDEIKNLLNVSEENFQSQHDLHFWFSKTSGQVSKDLNRIVDLETIDKSLYNVFSELKKARSSVDVAEQRLEDLRKQKIETKWIVQADSAYKEIEEIQEKINKKRIEIEKRKKVIEEWNRCTKKQEDLKEKLNNLKEIHVKMDNILKKRKEIEEKKKLIKEINEKESVLNNLKLNIKKEQERLNREMKGKICPICQQVIR